VGPRADDGERVFCLLGKFADAKRGRVSSTVPDLFSSDDGATSALSVGFPKDTPQERSCQIFPNRPEHPFTIVSTAQYHPELARIAMHPSARSD